MVLKRPTCQITKYSQKGDVTPGPAGQCASSAPIDSVNLPNSDAPPKEGTPMVEGSVQPATPSASASGLARSQFWGKAWPLFFEGMGWLRGGRAFG